MEAPASPRELVAWAIGMALSIGFAFLAGRNRWLNKTLGSITDAYEKLVTRLSSEIDRLHARVKELEDLTRPLRPASRRSATKIPPASAL